MMSATEQREVRERGRAPVGPVTEMMPLGEAESAPWEAAALVPMVEGPPQGRRNRPGPGSDLQQASLTVMAHHHPAGVAREALGRFRGNVFALLEDGLARLFWIGQHLSVDVDYYLVPFARSSRIEAVMESRLREQGQGIGLLLGHRGRFRGNVSEACGTPGPLPGRAQVKPDSPGQPGGAGAEARVPASPCVEFTDQLEQARGGRVEVGGELGNLVAEPLQLRGAMVSSNHSWQMDQHGEPSSC